MSMIKDFSQLPKNEQVYKLFHEGTELFARRKKQFVIKLFSFNEIFVEVWYDSTRNLIENIEVIEEENLIGLYDKHINLSALLKP